RHRHADRPLDLGAPGAATPGTRVCNHCAGPLALGARLPQLEESLPLDEFATTAAPGTGCPLVALASASGAFQTHFVPPDLDLLFDPPGRLDEFDVESHSQVAAALWPARPPAGPAAHKPEQVVDDVRERRRLAEAGLAHSVDTGVAEPVVPFALVLVGQDVVGLGTLLEPDLGLGVTNVPIGMILAGPP